MSEGGSPEPDIRRVAPGRVNLIGEHTDYSLLPVMPMAIDRVVEVSGWRRTDGLLRLDSDTFPDPLVLSPDLVMEEVSGWHRYALGAARVVLGDAFEVGADLRIDGDLPSFGGLSSSSALTVALVASLRDLAGMDADDDAVVDDTVRAERLTGVAGGTMDQNVIVRAKEGHALRIDFDPFATEQVPMPAGLDIVVGYSGSTAAKGAEAKAHYNGRVVGCRIAAWLLAERLSAALDPPYLLGGVAGLDGADDAIETLPEAAAPSQTPVGAAVVEGTGWEPDRPAPVRASARHVLAETHRVDQAQAALEAADLVELGRLLDASHTSLQDFGAATDGLDRLVAAMRQAGAYGARLTGAGFGGFAVAACPPSATEAVVAAAEGATGGPAFKVVASEGLA